MDDSTELKQITVRSMRGGAFSFGINDFRVDRGSYLGNPYEMDRNGSNRDHVIRAYKHWLFTNINHWLDMKSQKIRIDQWGFIDPMKLSTAAGLKIASGWKQFSVAQVESGFTRLSYEVTQRDINLICWCFPEPCHADILRSALIWYHKIYLEECLRIETTIAEFFD
jgi:hypothetical protein